MGDFYVDDGADWMYVEEDYPLEDELAETQIPDPGYMGTNFEIEMESYENDFYHFWDDVDYADDVYWDYDLLGTGEKRAGQKRKRATGRVSTLADKRQRTGVSDKLEEPVVFRSRATRTEALSRQAPCLKTRTKSALFPDWRTHFATIHSPRSGKEMPKEMQKAAESRPDDSLHQRKKQSSAAVDPSDEVDEDWEDDDEGDEEGLPAIDPDLLKNLLKQRMGDMGLKDADESAFMEVIQKMLSGEADSGNDLAGELANNILGKVTSDDGGTALAGWLSQQGVSLQSDDDEAASVATAELADVPSRSGRIATASHSDSAVMPESSSSRKRSASERKDQSSKRQKVRLDVPVSAAATGEANLDESNILAAATRDQPHSKSRAFKSLEAAGDLTEATEDVDAEEPVDIMKPLPNKRKRDLDTEGTETDESLASKKPKQQTAADRPKRRPRNTQVD